MTEAIRHKWRPSLGQITAGVIATAFLLPLASLFLISKTPAGLWDVISAEPLRAAAALVLAPLASVLMGFVFVRTITKPIGQLIERTEAIARGDRRAIRPLDIHGTREFAGLTKSFMGMATSLSERSDYLATYVAHISHELKTPLTGIRGAAELLSDGIDDMDRSDRDRFLSTILSDANRMTRLLDRLRDAAQADNPNTEGTTVFGEVFDRLRARFPDIDLKAAGPADQTIRMSLENAVMALSHLIDNAQHHHATLVRFVVKRSGPVVTLTINDDGDGISSNNRNKVFEPFFTTRRETGGTGMGLGIVQSLLKAHGGSIRLVGGPGGATFEVTIPAN